MRNEIFKPLGEAVPGEYAFSTRAGYRGVALPVIVAAPEVHWVSPLGPYAVELEGCGAVGEFLGIYHVFVDLAARTERLPLGAARYLVSVTDYDAAAIAKDIRRRLMAGTDPEGAGAVYPCPGGWVVVGVRPADGGAVPEDHRERIVADALNPEFWVHLNQQRHDQVGLDDVVRDAYREWFWNHRD